MKIETMEELSEALLDGHADMANNGTKQLIKLLRDNHGIDDARRHFLRNAKEVEPTFYVYDVIVHDDIFGGLVAESFVKEFRAAAKAPVVHVRIDSPGGDVFAARSIQRAILDHPGRVVAHVDGYAASAASYVAIAADEVVMSPGSFFMVHKARGLAFGDSEEMLAMADLLEKVDATLIDTYALKSKKDKSLIAQWMQAETWFTAAEAVDAGFADSIASEERVKAIAWNLSAYRNAPKKPDITARTTTQNTDHLRRQLDLKILEAA